MKPNHWPFKLPKPARNRLRQDVLEGARLTASQNEANLAETSAALRAAATTRKVSLASRKQDIETRIQSANAAGAIVA